MRFDEYLAGFTEEPGYLDYGRIGPISRAAAEEAAGFTEMLARSRHGAREAARAQDGRLRQAVAALTGFEADDVAFQPNTTTGLLHTMFGLTGRLLVSPGEFPALPLAAARAQAALHALQPVWLETDLGRVTPGRIRQQLEPSVVAVAVSLVDARTGYLCDIEGIRQVIGDRLLIVDAVQGFGIVDVPWTVADVVVSGGQKWCRAGLGAAFMALSARALERLTPVFSDSSDGPEDPWDEVPPPPPAAGARGFQIGRPDMIGQARFAAALEEIAAVGVPAINEAITATVSEVIALADEFAIAVISSRDERERAGIVVLSPPPEQLTLLSASLHNHGVTATTRLGTVRLSIHAGTDLETLAMLRAAFVSFMTATSY
jgi:selenocysteine lyase/cysteine desulfurase